MSKQCQFIIEKTQKPVDLKVNEIGVRLEFGQLGYVNIYMQEHLTVQERIPVQPELESENPLEPHHFYFCKNFLSINQ